MHKDGHEHHHENNGHTLGEGCTCHECDLGSVIKIILHEGAVSASFRAETSLIGSAVSNILSENMIRLAKWVKEKHGIIGHIKAVVTGGAGTKMFSITTDTVNSKDNGADIETPLEVLFTAIVFDIKAEEIKSELMKIYNEFIDII